MRGAPRTALLAGLLVSFVIAVTLICAVRVQLLSDREPSWALPRLIMGLGLLAAAAAAGGAAPGTSFSGAGARVVERVRQTWGRGWGIVLGRTAPEP